MLLSAHSREKENCFDKIKNSTLQKLNTCSHRRASAATRLKPVQIHARVGSQRSKDATLLGPRREASWGRSCKRCGRGWTFQDAAGGVEARKSKSTAGETREGKCQGLAGDVFRSLIFLQLCLGFAESCDLKECVPPEDVEELFRVQEGGGKSFAHVAQPWFTRCFVLQEAKLSIADLSFSIEHLLQSWNGSEQAGHLPKAVPPQTLAFEPDFLVHSRCLNAVFLKPALGQQLLSVCRQPTWLFHVPQSREVEATHLA